MTREEYVAAGLLSATSMALFGCFVWLMNAPLWGILLTLAICVAVSFLLAWKGKLEE